MTDPALLAAPTLPPYLQEFPLPDRAPYSIAVDMGLIRSEMPTAGHSNQRRRYRNMPQRFSLVFHMDTDLLSLWQFWANETAYDWFWLPLASMYAPAAAYSPAPAQPAGQVSLHIARFISDLGIAVDGHDWLAVTVAAELAPAMFASGGTP